MALQVQVTFEIEARLRRLALLEGKDLSKYLAELIEQATVAPADNGGQSVVEFDRALDELFEGDTRKLPPIPLTYTREDIYSDHD